MCLILVFSCTKVVKISSIEEIQKIGKDPQYPLDGNYELTNDIDASETWNCNNGRGFEPIGSEKKPFVGKFNGNGHKIMNLYINRLSSEEYTEHETDFDNDFGTDEKSEEIEKEGTSGISCKDESDSDNDEETYNEYLASTDWRVGLFRYIGENGEVYNLGLENVFVVGEYRVGGIAGENTGIIRECYVIGTVLGEEDVGMIAGYNDSGKDDSRGIISRCFAIGDLIGHRFTGGLVGKNYGRLFECYCAVRIAFSSDIPFYKYEGEFGITGLTYDIRESLKSCYWDIEVSEVPDYYKEEYAKHLFPYMSSNWETLSSEIAKSTSLMMRKDTYKDWDFEKVWAIEEDKSYPYLRCMKNFKFPLPLMPIEINDIEDLRRIGSSANYPPNGWYILTKDLDASETMNWNDGAGFQPINLFCGIFDGCGHTISNLYICRDFEDGVGLFRNSYGEIQNLNLNNVNVVGNHYVGAISGFNFGTIENCFVNGYIKGKAWVGSISGVNNLANIKSCYAVAKVVGSDDVVGGIAGSSWHSVLKDCFSNCYVKGDRCIGGLVGLNGGEIIGGFSEGVVVGNEEVDRLVGFYDSIGGSCEPCYSSANIVYLGGKSDGLLFLK